MKRHSKFLMLIAGIAAATAGMLAYFHNRAKCNYIILPPYYLKRQEVRLRSIVKPKQHYATIKLNFSMKSQTLPSTDSDAVKSIGRSCKKQVLTTRLQSSKRLMYI